MKPLDAESAVLFAAGFDDKLFELIGEAANRLPDEFRDQYRRIPWNKIIGMRNVLIHEYDSIDLDRVWETIQKDIPELEGYIESIPS
jgi:uncharacterized protein with HEPN domain